MWTASIGKYFLALRTIGSAAAICPTCLRGSISPLALMTSDDRESCHVSELCAQGLRRVVPGLRWRPCRSSRLFALAKLESAKSPLNASSDRTSRRGRAGAARERALHSAGASERHLRLSRTFRCESFRRSSSSQTRSGRAYWPLPQSQAAPAFARAARR